MKNYDMIYQYDSIKKKFTRNTKSVTSYHAYIFCMIQIKLFFYISHNFFRFLINFF